MAALSCNPILLGFSCQPLAPLNPGIYGNCLVALRVILCVILPPGSSQARARDSGPPLTQEGHSSRWEEAGKLFFVPKNRGFALKRWKPGVLLSGGNGPSVWTADFQADVFLRWRILQSAALQATFKMSISGVWNHSGCHSWVTLGLSRGVFREWERCWHQDALVCETQSITNNIFFKESYLLSYIFKRSFSVFIWYAHEEQRKACGLEPHFSHCNVCAGPPGIPFIFIYLFF